MPTEDDLQPAISALFPLRVAALVLAGQKRSFRHALRPPTRKRFWRGAGKTPCRREITVLRAEKLGRCLESGRRVEATQSVEHLLIGRLRRTLAARSRPRLEQQFVA